MDKHQARIQLRLLRASRIAALDQFKRHQGLDAKTRRQAIAFIQADIDALDFVIADYDTLGKTLRALQSGTVN